MRPLPAIVLASLGAGACSHSSSKETPAMTAPSKATEDDRLVERVRAAIEARTSPDSMAAFVGQKPIIDTTAGASLASLARVDFLADPDHADEAFERAKARTVIYWARPVDGDDPRVVGVQVDDEGRARVFFAIIPPP